MNRSFVLCIVAVMSSLVFANAQTCNWVTNARIDPSNTNGVSTPNCGSVGAPPDNLDSTGTDSCYFGCASGYQNGASGPNVNIQSVCSAASGSLNTLASGDPSASCQTNVCDAPPALTDAHQSTGTGAGSCGDVSLTNRLVANTGTCAATVLTGYAVFSGSVGSKTATISCTGSNVWATFPTSEAACDTYPSAVTSVPASSFTGGCATLASSPIKGDSTGTCSVNLQTAYFNFGVSAFFTAGSGIRGSKTAVPILCTGSNSFSSDILVDLGCTAPATASGALSATTSSLPSNACNGATATSAIRQGDSCKLSLATGYYDWNAANSPPATNTPGTCQTAATNTYDITNTGDVDFGCTAPPSTTGNAGVSTNGIGVDLSTFSCTTLSSTNPIRSGDNSCTLGTTTASRYYDVSGSSPSSTFPVTCNTVANTYTTSADIQQTCVNPTFTSAPAHVVIGTNCAGPLKTGTTCVATCDASSTMDATQALAQATYFTYSCDGPNNKLDIVGTNAAPICVPNGCSAAPATDPQYDFTAGSNPCSGVTTSNKIASAGTCTLACKPGYYAKNGVAPTFTCDNASGNLIPTSSDMCLPNTQLPITFFTYGTKLTV